MKAGETFTYIPWTTGSDDREMVVVKASGFWSLVKDETTGQHGIYNEKLRRLHLMHPRSVGKRGGPVKAWAQDVANKAGCPQRLADALVDLYR